MQSAVPISPPRYQGIWWRRAWSAPRPHSASARNTSSVPLIQARDLRGCLRLASRQASRWTNGLSRQVWGSVSAVLCSGASKRIGNYTVTGQSDDATIFGPQPGFSYSNRRISGLFRYGPHSRPLSRSVWRGESRSRVPPFPPREGGRGVRSKRLLSGTMNQKSRWGEENDRSGAENRDPRAKAVRQGQSARCV